MTLILHQNVTCGVAFTPMGVLRLASDILLVIRNSSK